MAIILPGQWTQQPQYPTPLSRVGIGAGIIYAVIPGFGIGAASSGVVQAVGSQGRQYQFGYLTTDVITAPNKGYPTGTQAFSAMALCKTDSGGDSRVLMAGTYDGTSVPFMLNVHTSSGSGYQGVGFYVGGWQTSGITDTSFVGDGKWHVIGGAARSGAQRYFVDGKLDKATTLTGTATSNSADWQFGNYVAASSGFGGQVAAFVLWDRFLSDAEFAEGARNLWQVFAPLPRRIFVQSGAASNDGTLARTNANDTSAASGSQTNTGTLARTNANDSVSAAGNLGTFNGAVAYTNANDTSTASGSQTNTGTLARTNADDTSAASGTQTNTGTLARTNADDSVSASGSAGTISGTVAYTNRNDTLTSTGGGGQSRGGIQRLKETKVKKSSTAVRDLLTETIDPQPAEIAVLAEEMREAVLKPEEEKAEAAAPIIVQSVPEIEDKEKETRRIARRRSVMHLLLLDDMSIEFHAEKVMNEAEVKRQALIADVKASLRQAIARRRNANG
jgi:hypothetical protein